MGKLFDTLTFVVLLIVMILASSCLTEPYEKKIYPIEQSLKIQETTGLKFEGPSITDGSLFNFKREQSGAYMLVVRDHFKNVISKSILDINTGDNVLSFYTNAINDGDYTVEFVDELGNVGYIFFSYGSVMHEDANIIMINKTTKVKVSNSFSIIQILILLIHRSSLQRHSCL